MAETIVAVLLLVGAAFSLLGAVGLVRFPDALSRLHGPGMIATLGLGALLLASAVHFQTGGREGGGRELLVTLFVLLTAPVGVIAMGRAARRAKDSNR